MGIINWILRLIFFIGNYVCGHMSTAFQKENNMDNNHDVKAMLEIVKEGYNEQSESVDVYKAQVRTIFGASSIIISLMSVLQIFSTIPEGFNPLFQAIIAGIVILYIILVVLSLVVLSPMSWFQPVKLDWDYMTDYFGGVNERDAILKRISAYLNVIELNQKYTKRRYCMTLAQGIIFGLIVLLVIVAGVLPYFVGYL